MSTLLFFTLISCLSTCLHGSTLPSKNNPRRCLELSSPDMPHISNENGHKDSTRKLTTDTEWDAVTAKAQNAVVKVIAQSTIFDWLKPFKAPDYGTGSGSAFFINKEGYLLTNYHVVEGAQSVYVYLESLGKHPLAVKVIGVCPDADVALLKLTDEARSFILSELKTISFLELGDSDVLTNAQRLLAVGFPFGQLKKTVGEVAGSEYMESHKSYIHITAPINPGNSGGPALNMAGEVVGINTAGVKEAQNVGYMIPINDIIILLDDLHKTPLVRKPRLGISCNKATVEHAQSLSNPIPSGVYINFVVPNSTADEIGIKQGDMLYSINGYQIDQYGDVKVDWRISSKVPFGQLLIRFAIGQKLDLVLYRNGERMEKSCIFKIPFLYPIRRVYPDFEPQAIRYLMFGGLCIMQLRWDHFLHIPMNYLLSQYLLQENLAKEVLVVTCVLPGSELDKVECFGVGSIIDKINGKEVHTLDQLHDALLLSAQTKHVAITTKDNRSTVVSLKKILDDESRLAQAFMFGISSTLKTLKKQWHGN